MGEINRRKMEDRKEIIKIKEPISTANKFHSSELFYIEEAKLPFSAGIYFNGVCDALASFMGNFVPVRG